ASRDAAAAAAAAAAPASFEAAAAEASTNAGVLAPTQPQPDAGAAGKAAPAKLELAAAKRAGAAPEGSPQDATAPAVSHVKWQAVVGGVVGAFAGLSLATGLFLILRAKHVRRAEAEASKGSAPRKSAGGDVEARGSRGGKRPSTTGGAR
ncbi:hypothetical protein MNEG_9576, partial [Monoraphidium neglectum]